jgi:hypothetical protein
MSNPTLESLPPHLLLDVLVMYIADGGNLHEICSSSSILAARCSEMKEPLMEALSFRRRIEAILEMDEWRRYVCISEYFEANRLDIVDICIQKLNHRLPRIHATTLLEDAAEHNNIPLFDYMLPKIDLSPIEYHEWDNWVIRVIRSILDNDIDNGNNDGNWRRPMLERLVQICRTQYGYDNDQIEQYVFEVGGLDPSAYVDNIPTKLIFLRNLLQE